MRTAGLAFDDPRWDALHGGYRISYELRPALTRLGTPSGVDAAWTELWDGLHHQGDVGEASYAAVPQLVHIHAERHVPDWNTFALVTWIEIVRQRNENPPVPDWLRVPYDAAGERSSSWTSTNGAKCGERTRATSLAVDCTP